MFELIKKLIQEGDGKPKAKDIITKLEGTQRLLYTDPSDPYESIYIRAKIQDGLLTVTDSECEHGPDGGWSHEILAFDKSNTQKAIAMLLERNNDPFDALSSMLSYENRTQVFRNLCKSKGIKYKNMFSF